MTHLNVNAKLGANRQIPSCILLLPATVLEAVCAKRHPQHFLKNVIESVLIEGQISPSNKGAAMLLQQCKKTSLRNIRWR